MADAKRKFIQALFLIDLALFLVIYDFFPLFIPMAGGGLIKPTANPGHLLMLCSAVILASIGVFLLVNAFYKWPSKSE